MRPYMMRGAFALILTMVTACSGSGDGSGGAAGALEGGGGGAGGVGGAPSTTSEPPAPICPTKPAGCDMSDPFLSFEPAAHKGDQFGPILPFEAQGVSIACLGPFDGDQVFTQALVGFGEQPPQTLLLDVWAQDTPAAAGHVFSWAARPLTATEPGPDGLTMGVYHLKLSPFVAAGGYVCVSAPLSAYKPFSMQLNACEQPYRAQWLGLPWHDDNGDGEATTDELTVAPLACPKDQTSDDGTPIVAPFHVALPYGVRQ